MGERLNGIQEVRGSIPLSSTIADGPPLQFPPPRRPAARGGPRPQTAPPPLRRALTDLDPVPFPGGVEAALEFAAFEKDLLAGGTGRSSIVRNRAPLDQEPPVGSRTPISEPDSDATRWMLAGAGVATAVALVLLLLSSGLLAAGFATVLQAMAQH